MANYDNYIQTYNSFSGVDIKAVFDTVVVGTLQGLSWSVTREKAPIYTMGQANPRAFNRGKRGIAGAFIFTVFDTDALLEALRNKVYLANKDDARVYTNYQQAESSQLTISSLDLMTAPQAATILEAAPTTANFDKEVREPFFADQMPPFNITMLAANEYGSMALKKILGVEILNEGSGVSIDDIVTEQQYTFVARLITPWIRQPRVDLQNSTAG
jgi:hypothetical protein